MKNTQKNLVTVTIPTYYGGPSLVKSVKSIFSSQCDFGFEVKIAVDGNPLDKKVEKELKSMGAIVLFSKERGGQVARIKQLVDETKSEFIVLTQDDVLFEENTLAELMVGLDKKKATMVAAQVIPLPASNEFEKVVQVGVDISRHLAQNWRQADNYFAASGRCLAFKTSFLKKMSLPEEVLNSDTYLYFLNKQLGGSFYYNPKAIYHIRSPKKLAEHLKQSRKYQYVVPEVKHYLGIDPASEQPLSKSLLFQAYMKTVTNKPVYAAAYIGLLLYSRLAGKDMYKNATRFWDTDASTKEL